jgi:4-methyl-5(b-hydroxyethyl)-thiazole monophosphate biosynthesis
LEKIIMARVLVPLAQGCEEIEAVTVIDLLRRAGVTVVAAGLIDGPVCASRGVGLLPDMTLNDALAHEYDMIVLPGGMPGSEHLKNDPRIISLMKHMAAAGKYITAICAAPMALHAAGLLDGKNATSFPGVLDQLPGSHRYLNDAVVVDGNIITSRGPGTAMDFALTLIELLVGKTKRDLVEAGLERPVK